MLTYAELVHAAYRRHGDRPAFVTSTGDRLTYAACAELLNRLTRALHTRGVRRGSGVALLSRNRPEQSLAAAAALTLGARVSVLPPGPGLAARLDLAAPDVLLLDPPLAPLLPGSLPAVVLGLGPGAAPDLLAAAAQERAAAVAVLAGPDDVAFVHFTSGSTGPAKAVTTTQASAALGALLLVANLEWPEQLRFLACTGMAQVMQVPIRLRGGCVHLQDGFDPDRVRAAVGAEGITATLLTPAAMLRLARGGPLPGLGSLFYAGAVVPPAHVAEAAEAFGPVLVQGYAQIEVSTWATALGRSEHRTAPPGSAGRPLPGVDVSVRDPAGDPVAPGTAGEVCLRGPTLTLGYWRDPAATAALRRDGWLRTGDDGLLDPDGYLHLLGRRADRLGAGRWARQLEDAACAHPDVADAAALPGVLTVVPRPGREVSVAAVRDLLPFDPVQVRVAAALPYTPAGKLDRAALLG